MSQKTWLSSDFGQAVKIFLNRSRQFSKEFSHLFAAFFIAALYHKRRRQALEWMGQLLEEGLKDWFYQTPEMRRLMPELTHAVANGSTTPTAAVKKMLDAVNIH